MSKRKFEKFYKKHIDKVYRYVLFRVSKNKDVAEDLVSEIFIKALNAFAKFDDKKGDSAWIITITKNHLANYWRDRKEELSIDVDNSGTDDEYKFSLVSKIVNKTMFHRAMGKFKRKQNELDLEELMKVLNEKEYDIVTLHYISGYKYTEIAKMKNINLSAVKVMSHRAIKKIREQIKYEN